MARRSLPAVLAAVAAGALLVRLLALDARVAHWDEARVAYWTLQYLERGAWSYHPIVHGPFLFHVNRLAFATLGATDVTMRLVVAVVGGLSPLAAWLLRTRLTRGETLALAAILAASPLFVFYSRFARNDLLLAVFALVTVGLAVRAWDAARGSYLPAAGVALGLAFTTKENAVLYLLCWLGAGALVLARGALTGGAPRRTLRRYAESAARVPERFGGVGPTAAWTAAAALSWLVVVVGFYAPRSPEGDGLRASVADPALLPALVAEATLGSASKLVATWVGGYQTVGGRTLLYFGHLVAILLVGAAALVALSAYGVAVERRRESGVRPLVAMAVAWAGLSLAGYPFAADMAAPWLAVHVALPLVIPAAVGLAAAGRRLSAARATEDARTVRRVVLVLVVLGAQAAAVGAATSYLAPNSELNPLAQPAQPDGDLRATATDVSALAGEGDQPTALYVGPYFDPDYKVRRFPLRWYLASEGYETRHVASPADVGPDPPPVVVALDAHRPELDERLRGYTARTHEFDTWVSREPAAPFSEVVVYVDSSVLDAHGDHSGEPTRQ